VPLSLQACDERVQQTLLLTTGQDRKPAGGVRNFWPDRCLLGHSLKKSESIPRIGSVPVHPACRSFGPYWDLVSLAGAARLGSGAHEESGTWPLGTDPDRPKSDSGPGALPDLGVGDPVSSTCCAASPSAKPGRRLKETVTAGSWPKWLMVVNRFRKASLPIVLQARWKVTDI
jgi:hypothetical protein